MVLWVAIRRLKSSSVGAFTWSLLGGGGGGGGPVGGGADKKGGKKKEKKVPLVEFMYLVFTRMPGESCLGRLRSLYMYLCHVFQALINSPVC